MAIAKPQPPPHTSLHPSPAAVAAVGGNLTGTGPSSSERYGDTPGRYPHISTTHSLFPAPAPYSSWGRCPPPSHPPLPLLRRCRGRSSPPGAWASESTADFDRWPTGADNTEQVFELLRRHISVPIFYFSPTAKLVSPFVTISLLFSANRHFGETNMNMRSSRSHTIFRMV